MNAELKQAMQNLVEMAELEGRIQGNARMMGALDQAVKQAARDLLEEARLNLAKKLRESGYPQREWHNGSAQSAHLTHPGGEAIFAELMAKSAQEAKQQLVYTQNGVTLYRAFPATPGRWDKMVVAKGPATTNDPPVGDVVWETPPEAPMMPIGVFAPPIRRGEM